MSDEPLIVQTIRRYHPEFSPPKDTGRTWIKCRCPWHGDDHASAGISYELDSFCCLGCGVKGNSTTLTMRQEGLSHREIDRRAAEVSPRSDQEVQPEPRRKPGRRRVFGEEGAGRPERKQVLPARVRRRPPPWA